MHQNEWASGLDRYWGDLEPGSRVLLMLEPSLLRHVAELAGLRFETDEAIQADFLSTVRQYIHIRGKVRGPWHSEPFRPGTPPRFLLQIAVQVYAASKMADDPDGHHTVAAYYVQLESLVGDAGAKERFAWSDQGEYHQQLWRERLADWARDKGLVLRLPEDRDGAFRHVQLPKSQAAFRVGDLQRLPYFFQRCRFRPLDEANPTLMETQLERVDSELRRQKDNAGCFSSWGRRVLNDRTKFPIAVHQIEEALRTWDGRWQLRDIGFRRGKQASKTRWIWLAIQFRRRQLRAFSGCEFDLAEKLSVEQLSALLAGDAVGSDQIELHEGLALFCHEEETATFKQAEYVEAGERGLIVAGPAASVNGYRLDATAEFCAERQLYMADAVEGAEQLDGIPSGCVLLEFRLPHRMPAIDEIPELWHSFLRTPPAGLYLSGGLRINRKDQWIVGAGPRLKVSGNRPPRSILVDGEQVPIRDRLVRLDQFSRAGDHEIVASIDGQQYVKLFNVGWPEVELEKKIPERCWTFFANQWPALSSVTAEQAKSVPPPRLWGVHGENLAPVNGVVQSPTIDRLVAIRLLVGLSINEPSMIESKHPLVKHLVKVGNKHRSREVTA